MQKTIILENDFVKLSPLTIENHLELIPIASQEKLVQFSPSDIETPSALKKYVETALEQQKEKKSIPFIIFDKRQNSFTGCTRYMNINWQHKVLEIGSTWIGREFQGSGLNSHMKDLMINHAFEKMDFEKIEFRIDERNVRSRKAVEKLGGILEGTLRKNVFLLDGFKRNTCCYGILKEEWKNRNSN
ncbi:GNAT family N-acetyltransferase [Maribacter sp. HTCC2170]|uniref:GNAT family N-acetyltransferase n=1 Tax=Maribacter sp. (strain HTCC2170 / KCCM 42371) TaxID=313603 RepID=UPI00006B2213|nr:GNAT family protein [Maribacter sp. HTCC2170]EAR00325.1 putative amino-acid acetyltransferase [Maribacter sp. HTCC2170]